MRSTAEQEGYFIAEPKMLHVVAWHLTTGDGPGGGAAILISRCVAERHLFELSLTNDGKFLFLDEL